MVPKAEGWSRGRIDLLHSRLRKVTISRKGTQPVIANLTAHACTPMRESRSTNLPIVFVDIVALHTGQLAQRRFAPRSLRTHHVSSGSTHRHADNDQIVD